MKLETLGDVKIQNNNEVKLKKSEKLSYGLGDFASNLIWGFIGSFLLYYYTDVALIPVAATATLFLFARILDAFIDPVIGGFVDRTNTKYGRTRPYILFGIIPLAIILVLTFTSFNISNTGKIIYEYITYIVIGIVYSVVNIPYGALMPLMTRDTNEKAQLSSFRMIGMAAGNIFVTAGTMPLVKVLGKGDEKTGFILTTILYAIIGVCCYLTVSFKCKERYIESNTIEKNKSKANIIKTYKNAMRNVPWVTTIIFALFMFVKIGAVTAITIYFCNCVLKNSAMVSILLPLQYVSLFFSSAIAPLFIKKFGHRNANIISLIIYSISFCIMPFFSDNMTIFIGVYFIGNIFGGIGSGSVFGMTADSVDYNEWKFGERSEGTLYAGYSFATKVGMAIGGAVIGYVLAFAGYNANNISSSIVNHINLIYYTVPVLCSIIQIVSLLFYNLDSIHPQIVRELEEKNKQEA
ncbi:glycoside-pentoside-hexuronide (GPH):cation symporter [Clostridium sp. SHJSY1]|uniref:MFS transporter n=1 Tax=Clostridium sp. SHJSY1 TaxID=2942483 RepID=UPI002874F419|nr:glycoside-pentoside-hexuronide (GPH):cation symporter [Clostridium sp. SHJSY1]MDS0524185.1 glycoside-pentoside-hexuronide (GPH):cation symporter [Clostridium sp. SHJSY1]